MKEKTSVANWGKVEKSYTIQCLEVVGPWIFNKFRSLFLGKSELTYGNPKI